MRLFWSLSWAPPQKNSSSTLTHLEQEFTEGREKYLQKCVYIYISPFKYVLYLQNKHKMYYYNATIHIYN